MTETGFLETLKRVEDVAGILTRMEDINVVLGKIMTIEAFIDRFGTLEALIERFESVENQLYYLKDMLNIDEAAKYLNISKGHMYRLTSNRDISYTKPNGKNIFFERKELDEWKRRNPVPSQRELERQVAIMTVRDHTDKSNHKKKGEKTMTPTNLLQIGNDIDRSVYEQILQFIRLRVTETYAFPPEIVRVDDITIATLGNFSASVGKPKSKKTFNITAIVASALSGKNVLRYNAHLPEGKHKVLYVDTEQSKCHCHKVLERILRLAGLPTDCEADNLDFFMLREYSPKQRRQIINHALASDPGIGFVVIDGIRDLLYDINSPSESVDLINDLMRWSSMHDLHIHTVLHLNKGDDNTRGHIGTELNNKAETILQVTKSQFDGNISEVKAMHIREKEFEPFAFRINNDALPELVGEYSFTQERKGFCESISDVQHAQALRLAFNEGDITGYRPLIKALQQGYTEIGFKRGRNICIELNKYLMGRGIIVKQDKSYRYNPEVLEHSGCTSDKEV